MLSVFNPVWLAVIALAPVVIILITLCLKKKSAVQKQQFLEKLILGTLVFFVLYKIWLFLDDGYDTHFFEELPINLCNLGLLTAYPAIRKNIRPLKAFLYFCCTLGAVMALLMPSEGFYDAPIWYLRMIGYWGTHLLVLIIPILMVTLGLYRPRLKDIPAALLLLLCVALIGHLANFLLRPSICPDTNYCFTYGIEGNPVTELLMRYIPIPFVYLLPMLIPLYLVDCGLCALAALSRKKGAA